jgi:hypothetical protein
MRKLRVVILDPKKVVIEEESEENKSVPTPPADATPPNNPNAPSIGTYLYPTPSIWYDATNAATWNNMCVFTVGSGAGSTPMVTFNTIPLPATNTIQLSYSYSY